MDIPKFLLSSNSNFPDILFVVHTEFPRFVLNIINDQIFWLEDFDKKDLEDLKNETQNLINEALSFYDQEITKLK